MTIMLGVVVWLAWQYGDAWILFSALLAAIFIAPLACIGTYAISAQLERGQQVSLRRTLRASSRRYLGNELVFALVLMVIFLVWARASSVISIFLPASESYTFSEAGGYVLTLSLVGLLFLAMIFAASVFALPMIMHRDVDAITAIVTSINAVLRNKRVMLVWAFLIGLGLTLGILSGGILLVLFLPAIGHAVWHGYLETIDASQFPRHQIGVTAQPRS